MEPAMEPETLEARISECPGGARAGPEPEPGARGGPLPGGGGVRGAPSPRPASGPGEAAPRAGPSDPEVKEEPTSSADPRWQRAPPAHPILGGGVSCAQNPQDGDSGLEAPEAQTSLRSGPPQVIPLGPGGGKPAALGLHLRPQREGPYSPWTPNPPLSGPAWSDSLLYVP